MGIMKRGVFKVGPVSRTLISVDRLQETGHDVILTKSRPHIVNMKTGEILLLRKDGACSFSTCGSWCRRVVRKRKAAQILYGRGKASNEDFVSPRSHLSDKQLAGIGCKDIMSHDEDVLTLNVDGEALEEEMECELEDETVQDAESVRTTSEPGQPIKKEREEHEAAHA